MNAVNEERPRIYLTPEGVEELHREMDYLVQVRRPALAERLHRAIQQGDLSENADYITAKEEQGFLEGRILQIDTVLRNALVVESVHNSSHVIVGSRVTVREADSDLVEVYHVVGFAEADPSRGKVSSDSPMGQALLGHAVGDTVVVRAPAGNITFEITSIE